jgi:hypothetical protein
MLGLNEVLLLSGLSAIVVMIGLSLWKWSREHYRFITASVATFLGFAAWNVLQSDNGAYVALNTDRSVTPFSLSDASTGVWAFAFTTIALAFLTERNQPAWRVILAAGVAGALAASVHIILV